MTAGAGTVRWGILGPGRIASNVARDWASVTGGELAAVASRSPERARAFAEEFAIPRAYGSYEELLADPQIDAVYVATPHSFHRAHGLAVIAAGKALLMEKSFTATLAGAEDLVAAARAAGTFVMEAMWTRFQPAVVRLRQLIADGAIGEVRNVQAELGVSRPLDPRDRTFALDLGGGTILDLGVYVVSFAHLVLGAPDRVSVSGSLLPTGTDAESAYLLAYEDGRAATLSTSFLAPSPGMARVFGTEGWLELPPRFHHPDRVILHRPDAAGRTSGEPEVFHLPPRGAGYAHEFDEVHDCLARGASESATMPLEASLAVQTILQQAADDLGVELYERE
ncbi:Gfo/Idh/MocA family protein [Pseudactinotalea sp. HY158]|uniref:Gfo/Idh/MocA family protein n=1 Tax=Pseudactinotalea sp. HY158 TaxID=2654547 RepID=UPI00129C5035|nr:Gfo/Idh/MocA family oxidoreductase [Pseudactinotalea sp. HY158]QGH68400.1 gfo/Idh/MocA family oxidoreductase [Pseudactinotalea sp. HY158]